MPRAARSPKPKTPRVPAGRLRILNWNILEGASEGRLDGLLREIRALRPHVVALQECNGWHARGERILRQVADVLRMQAFPHWTVGGFQPVVLTSLAGARAVWHDDQDHFRHGYQEVLLPLDGGREWRFFNTHLDPFLESARLAEVRTILRAMKPHFGGFCSLVGDLNSVAPGESVNGVRLGRATTRVRLNDHPILRVKYDHGGMAGTAGWTQGGPPRPLRQVPGPVLRQATHVELRTDVYRALARARWVDAFRKLHPREPGLTIDSNVPRGRIDYTWLSPALARRLRRIEVLYGPRLAKLSDHCPILWEVELD
ncbi:MAG: endonuclease/exonuclease/phosphatase family protein [Planctomycetota bacterium]|nr:endonuclease/exonuclease/phosphatase family protein [Planctomycetota bacterium]